jgi:hypothetical protein
MKRPSARQKAELIEAKRRNPDFGLPEIMSFFGPLKR